MNLPLRILASLAVVAGATYAVWLILLPGYTCNIARDRVTRRFDQLQGMRNSAAEVARPGIGRENTRDLIPCVESPGRSIHDFVMLAESARLLGNTERAAELYEQALRFEPRPELYYQQALLQLELHRRTEARRMLLLAGYSAQYINLFPDTELRDSVTDKLGEREKLLRAKLAR